MVSYEYHITGNLRDYIPSAAKKLPIFDNFTWVVKCIKNLHIKKLEIECST